MFYSRDRVEFPVLYSRSSFLKCSFRPMIVCNVRPILGTKCFLNMWIFSQLFTLPHAYKEHINISTLPSITAKWFFLSRCVVGCIQISIGWEGEKREMWDSDSLYQVGLIPLTSSCKWLLYTFLSSPHQWRTYCFPKLLELCFCFNSSCILSS